MYRGRAQNSTAYPIPILMVSSADHVTGLTGKTLTVTLSKNGGAFAAASGAVTEIGNGWYALAGNATDRNTVGELVVHATASGCDPFDATYAITGWDPFSLPVSVAPLSASVADPVARVTAHVAVFQAMSGPDLLFTILDADGNARNLSGKTLRLAVWNPRKSPGANVLFTRNTGGDGITIGGAGNNLITVAYTTVHTATPGAYKYTLSLLDDATTNDEVLAQGNFEIREAVKTTS